jgi:hypothetical protein
VSDCQPVRTLAIGLALFCMNGLITPCAARTPRGYEAYTAWEQLPRLRLGFRSGLASSHDRSGGNDDYSHYESPPGLITESADAVVATLQGPGMICRFWMPHAMARRSFLVRMYFDGEQIPRIDTDSSAVMSGSFDYFAQPLVDTCAGGQVCYEPIPFARSLRIETVNKELSTWAHRHYYQYSYITLPNGTPLDSYTGSLTPQQQQARAAAISLFENAGRYPGPTDPAASDITLPATQIPGGASITVADLTGPGMIRQLNIRMEHAGDQELAALRLLLYYDGNAAPAIDASVANLFGAGRGRGAYRSIPIGTEPIDPNDGFYCYWPMPFHNSALIRLHNTAVQPVTVQSARVRYIPAPIQRNVCYLHAAERVSTRQSGQVFHTLLSTTGRGHYLGELLYVEQDSNSFYMLEGDDVITVDGKETQNGTGLEDTYNGGAYYNWIVRQSDEPEGPSPRSATRPLSGILYVHREEGMARADQYRWRIADCVPFSRSIDVKVECRYAQAGSRWTSVCFWYELPGLLEDLNGDEKVDSLDYAAFAQRWPETDCGDCDGADLDGDGRVAFADLQELLRRWLSGTP